MMTVRWWCDIPLFSHKAAVDAGGDDPLGRGFFEVELPRCSRNGAKCALDGLSQGARRVAGGIAVQQEEGAGLLCKESFCRGEEGREVLFYMPDLALRPSAEGGRVEDDAVVLSSAPHFALGEGKRVVREPANSVLVQAGHACVLVSPVERLLRGVHVRHFGTGMCSSQGRDSRVAEQVEYRRSAECSHTVPDPLPIRLLLGKGAHMLEARETCEKAQGAMRYFP